MARIRRIEDLPQDCLREIIIRVARQPEGAFNIARTFAVSKTFRNFSKDTMVLRTLSFTDLFPRFARRYEPFSEVGGLVARCARAGNFNAQFILAKVVMVSASKLCNARVEEALHYPYASLELCDFNKATCFLNNLSAQNTDPSELLDLVRNFLSRAKALDLIEMHPHLKDFVVLYLVHGEKIHHQKFLTALNNVCKDYIPHVSTPNPLTFIILDFNILCDMTHNIMKYLGIDEELYRPLLQSSVDMNDDIVYETLIERLDIIEPILKLGDHVTSLSSLAAMLRNHLKQLIDHEAFLQSARELLLEKFNALFYG